MILSTDASNFAVAGIFSHEFPTGEKRPIAFVSRALSKTERKYSTLEKEALAIVFCLIKLKQYLLGNHFTLRTDHKPLLTIFGENKGLPVMAAACMQRWAVLVSTFSYSIQYVKGKSNEADGLSRIPNVENIKDEQIESNFINLIESENHLHISFKDVARETKRDPVLSKLTEAIQRGIVKNLKGVEYQAFRDKDWELSVESDCILWGYRTVIPTKLRQNVLMELHRSHLGIVKTKALSGSYVWWPKIDGNIEKIVRNCVPCQELQVSPEKSKLIPWKPCASIWSRIHIDFAGPINGQYLFIVIDSLSKWAEVFKTKDITSTFTIGKIRELISRYGLPDTIVSDNGRQFTSDEFKSFLKLNNIRHILTAPGRPATNGQAENFVKTLKKAIFAVLKTSKHSNLETIILQFLFDYRNTKHCTTGETPAKKRVLVHCDHR